jgi:hypothetical protein
MKTVYHRQEPPKLRPKNELNVTMYLQYNNDMIVKKDIINKKVSK